MSVHVILSTLLSRFATIKIVYYADLMLMLRSGQMAVIAWNKNFNNDFTLWLICLFVLAFNDSFSGILTIWDFWSAQ